VLRLVDVPDAIDLDLPPGEAREMADDFMIGCDPSRAIDTLNALGDQLDARGRQWWPVEATSAGRSVHHRLLRGDIEAER
jgi:hypothetical protein